MRILLEILTLIGGIAIILALAKGFPAFGAVLRALFLDPIGLLVLAGLGILIAVRRKRQPSVEGKEPMKIDLDKLRRSGEITATARETCKKMILPGARLEEIALEAERIILDMGGEPAFPAQLSCNHIAAHYCSPPGDPTVAGENDIIKMDMGTHVDGWVTDSATTVDLRDGPDSLLVKASEMALENAISVMGPGASITEVGRQIESTIKAMGFTPIYNLTGHGVARYIIHCKPSIPNYPDTRAPALRTGQMIACEPFACDGQGSIAEKGEPEVFMLQRSPSARDLKKLPPDIAEAIEKTNKLPFARRTLLRHLGSEKKVEQAMKLLYKTRLIEDYPPLVEKAGVRVAQTEHTMVILEDGVEVLTRAPASLLSGSDSQA